MLLPNNYTIVSARGSSWSATFTVQNSDGTLADISNKTFEFVVRNRLNPVGVVLFSVTSTATSTFGGIVVDVEAASVQVVLNVPATEAVPEGGGPYTLWMDQGLPDATALVTGVFYTNPVAEP